MSKRWIWLVGLICCSAMAGLVLAESVEIDTEAMKSMSRDERIAYQRAYKAKIQALTQGTQKRREFTPAGRQAAAPNKAIGSITYHSGALGACCLPSFMQGNQFDSALDTSGTVIAPVMMSGSITMATFDMITVSAPSVFLSVYDQQAGTTANFITSILTTAATGLNVKTVGPVVYAGTSFLAGAWQGGGDVPAVATGTVGGQGFHGVEINDIVGTGFATIGALNAACAVGGNVLTPVELLNFEIE